LHFKFSIRFETKKPAAAMTAGMVKVLVNIPAVFSPALGGCGALCWSFCLRRAQRTGSARSFS
jgi:hypothetical protein